MEDREVTSRMIRVTTPDGMTKDMRFVAKYDRSADKFYVEVPHWLLLMNEDDRAHVRGDTPKQVLSEVERIADRYKGHLTKKRKVILLLFAGCRQGQKKSEFDKHDNTSLSLRFHVCWEFFTPGHENRQYGETEARPSRVDGEWIDLHDSWDETTLQVLDWTAERENYLRSLRASMEAALDRGLAFFKNVKKAGKRMDEARKQLLLT